MVSFDVMTHFTHPRADRLVERSGTSEHDSHGSDGGSVLKIVSESEE
jgi:hypothetical protein